MDVREKPSPAALREKAWRVVNSCETPKQAQGAMKYLDLLEDQHPELNTKPLRDELVVLFDLRRMYA